MSLNTVDETKNGEIAFVELHDSKVEALALRMDQTCVINFHHLPVYHLRAAENFAIWSYRGTLELRGVDRLVCEGGSPARDYVSDAHLFNGDVVVEWKTLLKNTAVTRLEMIFGSGRRIEVACHEASLTLDEAVKHFEDWQGPL